MRHTVLALCAAAGILGFPVAAVAHDPGLSSLKVRVSTGDIVVDLSMAAADAAALAGSDADVARLGSFALQAICLMLVLTVGRLSGPLFSLTLVLTFFTWGEVFSLFPSILGD